MNLLKKRAEKVFVQFVFYTVYIGVKIAEKNFCWIISLQITNKPNH